MRIWHQSFTDLSTFPAYRLTLERHAASVMGQAASVTVHGLRPGTYAQGVAPMVANANRYIRALHEQQVCEAAMTAEREGYDAMALGCFFDPALQAARSLTDMPIVSLAETCMLTACSLGRKFAMISLSEFQQALTEDLAAAYGLTDRLACVLTMTPAISLFDLETDDGRDRDIADRFRRICATAIGRGAEVIIPGDGVLNEFLVRHALLEVEGAVVMDSLGVLFQHAAFFAGLRRSTGLTVSRRGFYAMPVPRMLEHARGLHALRGFDEGDFSGR